VSAVHPIQKAFQLHTQGQLDQAKSLYLKILKAQPTQFDARQLLGALLHTQGHFEEALRHLQQALKLNARDPGVWLNAGNVFAKLQNHQQALICSENALALKPGYPEALNNRANALRQLGRMDEALRCFDSAIAARAGFLEALTNRANTLSALNRHNEAIEAYGLVFAVKPDHAEAVSGALHSAYQICDWSSTDTLMINLQAAVSRGVLVDPLTFVTFSHAPDRQRLCAEQYVRMKAPKITPRPLGKVRRSVPGERIRIGYLSTDFRTHPVAYQIAELFELHDRSRFEVIGVSSGIDDQSPIRQRIVRSFDQFIDIEAADDANAASRIRASNVDILVDLNGHTLGCRLGVLAQRPAPVQVAYLGFPGTTGASFIDYVIADPWLAPLDHQAHFSEQIAQLPHSYMPHDRTVTAAPETPTRASCGLPEDGFVYCSFNANYKFTPVLFDVWMRLLAQTPGSVLWLRQSSTESADNLRREASARGFEPARLVFAKQVDMPQHLARHRLADLFLDTHPFNSHSTGATALWAGLPMITCLGDTFTSRVGASLVAAACLPELITASLPDYEARALQLAHGPDELKLLRARLIAARRTAPLFDTDQYRRDLEAAYLTIWNTHQAGKPPTAFAVPSRQFESCREGK
jgi:protein O-GlcNAc transferase